MSRMVNESVHLCNPGVAAAVHYPTNGSLGKVPDVEAREIVAANLNALMAYAKDSGHPERSSNKGLAKLSGISRPTIREMRAGERDVGIDTLQAIAEVFDIEAWTLLVPRIKPASPPTKPISLSKSELKLYKRLGDVAREYEENQEEQDEKGTSGAADPDRDSQGEVGSGKRKRGKRPTA